MRIVFMGTPEFSVSALKSLVGAGHEIIAVLTQPDRPKGRGNQVQFSPVKEEALRHNIPVYQPLRIKSDEECKGILKSLNPDVCVVVAFGQILPQDVLDIPKYGCINIHASLLPKYRGAAPIQRVIVDGEKETGVTTMLMDAGLDTGDILEMEKIEIASDETGGSLHDKLAELGGQLILSTLEKLEAGTLVRTKQEGETCYASMLRKEEGLLDFSKTAEELDRRIRGFYPWPSAYTSFHGKMLKIWKASVVSKNSGKKEGSLLVEGKNQLLVQTKEGCLNLQEVQLEGKKRMAIGDFLRGNSILEEDYLGQ